MKFSRYSAVEMFGVPIDNPEFLSSYASAIKLMDSYDVERKDIEAGPVDITPDYWRDPNFKYFLSMSHPEGPVVVDLMPRRDDVETHLLGQIVPGVIYDVTGMRHIEIPTDQNMMAIIGPGPRFAGQICVHELIAYTD